MNPLLDIGFGRNTFFRWGWQNWIDEIVKEKRGITSNYVKTELARKNIESVSKSDLAQWILDTREYHRKKKEDHYLNTGWEQARNLYNDEWWSNDDDDGWRSKVTANLLVSLVEQRVSYVTSNPPAVAAHPVEDGDNETAFVISDIILSILHKNEFPVKAQDAKTEAETLGTSYLKAEWDTNLSFPLGDVRIKNLSPSVVTTDTDAEDLQLGKFVFEDHWMTLEDIKRIWGQKANRIRQKREKGDGYEHNEDFVENDKVLVVEAWIYDQTVQKINTEEDFLSGLGVDTEDLQLDEELELKYKNGRWVVVAEGIVLEDSPVDAELYKNGIRFPYVTIKGNRQPHEQYGKSTILKYEPIVREIVQELASMGDVMKQIANPVPVVAKGQFENPEEELVMGPDTILEYRPVNGASPPHWLQPPPGALNNATQHINTLMSLYQVVANFGKAGAGIAPGSIQSGRGILALIERIDQTNTIHVQDYYSSMRVLAKAIFAFVQSEYGEERIIRRTSKTGETEILKINSDTAGRVLDPTVGIYDVEFEVGSTLPTSKAAKFEEAMQMGQLGFIDPISLLEYSEIPNIKDIVRRQVGMGNIPKELAIQEGYIEQDSLDAQLPMSKPGAGFGGGDIAPDNTNPVLPPSEKLNA